MLTKAILMSLLILGVSTPQIQAAAAATKAPPAKSAQDVAMSYVKLIEEKKSKIVKDTDNADPSITSDVLDLNVTVRSALTFLITGNDKGTLYGITSERDWNPEEEGTYNLLITVAANKEISEINVDRIGEDNPHANEVRRRYKAARKGAIIGPMPSTLGYLYMPSLPKAPLGKGKPKPTAAATLGAPLGSPIPAKSAATLPAPLS